MGIDLNGAQLLINARKIGVSFERMATLGRQEIHAYRPGLISILGKSGYDTSTESARALLDPSTKFSDGFFSLLGAKEIDSIDAGDYEGASILHDMNRPIPDNLISSFDLVLDGGTLEHVFDLPVALRNAARMVRPNGHFMSLTMANNFCGHGFYQFSPELFYRFLCPENGFVVESCILWEDLRGNKFYQISDPERVGSRVEFTSRYGVYMFVIARRIGDVPQEFIPQQSDYVVEWQNPADAAQSSNRLDQLKRIVKRSRFLRSVAGSVLNRRMRFRGDPRKRATPMTDLRVM